MTTFDSTKRSLPELLKDITATGKQPLSEADEGTEMVEDALVQ